MNNVLGASTGQDDDDDDDATADMEDPTPEPNIKEVTGEAPHTPKKGRDVRVAALGICSCRSDSFVANLVSFAVGFRNVNRF